MRNLYDLPPEFTRVPIHGQHGDGGNGAFTALVPNWHLEPKDGGEIHVLATSGMGWDHVSVSMRRRCPRWEEMEWVKRAFFRDDECAYQLHVPVKDHINRHPYCLHIWRPQLVPIPLPPSIMVG